MTSLDEETRDLFSRAQSESNDTQLMPSSPAGTASGTWLFTDKDIGDGVSKPSADDAPTALATAIMPGTAAGEGLTAQLEALKGQGAGDVDLDLGGLDMTGRARRGARSGCRAKRGAERRGVRGDPTPEWLNRS